MRTTYRGSENIVQRRLEDVLSAEPANGDEILQSLTSEVGLFEKCSLGRHAVRRGRVAHKIKTMGVVDRMRRSSDEKGLPIYRK